MPEYGFPLTHVFPYKDSIVAFLASILAYLTQLRLLGFQKVIIENDIICKNPKERHGLANFPLVPIYCFETIQVIQKGH